MATVAPQPGLTVPQVLGKDGGKLETSGSGKNASVTVVSNAWPALFVADTTCTRYIQPEVIYEGILPPHTIL